MALNILSYFGHPNVFIPDINSMWQHIAVNKCQSWKKEIFNLFPSKNRGCLYSRGCLNSNKYSIRRHYCHIGQNKLVSWRCKNGVKRDKTSCWDTQPFKPFFPSFFFRFLQQHFLIMQKQQRRTTRRTTIPIVTIAHIGTEMERDTQQYVLVNRVKFLTLPMYKCVLNVASQPQSLLVRRHLFDLLDTLYPLKFFRCVIPKIKLMWWNILLHTIIFQTWVTHLQVAIFLINYQILIFKYHFIIIFWKEFDKLATVFFSGAKVCLW